MDRKTGLFSCFALAKASAPQDTSQPGCVRVAAGKGSPGESGGWCKVVGRFHPDSGFWGGNSCLVTGGRWQAVGGVPGTGIHRGGLHTR